MPSSIVQYGSMELMGESVRQLSVLPDIIFPSSARDTGAVVVQQPDEMTAAYNWPSPYEHPLFFVGVYTAIGFGTAFIQILSSGIQLTGALRASRVLFRKLLRTVVFATVRFHDTTPAGQMFSGALMQQLMLP